MRFRSKLFAYSIFIFLSGCVHNENNPIDPFENINRRTYKFNTAFDATMLKPPTKLYKAILPNFVRSGINNAFNNLLMIPTIVNDLLQAEGEYAIKDTWRFLINSTVGIAGIVDVAASNFKLPPHSNDFGLTFAKWGNKQSPYIILPLLGPSTLRDGIGMVFESLLTPYPYFLDDLTTYAILGVRTIDLRAQALTAEHLLAQSFDEYTFVRDAYLQYRNAQVNGNQQESELGTLYVD